MRSEGGFTLIESLVALAVLAITLVVLLQVSASAARRLAQAEELSYATLAAQSVLAAAGIETRLAIGTSSGGLPHGLAWRQRIAPLPGASRARTISVTVQDSQGRTLVTLETVRLDPQPPAPR